MAEEKEEMVFPIVQDDCPKCGCKERLGKMTIDRLIKKGLLSKGLYPDGLMWTIPMVDQKRITSLLTPTVKVPVLNIFFDICKECHTVYCTKYALDIQEMPVQLQQMPHHQGGQRLSNS